MDDKSFVSHVAVIRKAEWNPGKGVSVRIICNLIHTVQHKDHWLAAGGFLHQVLAIKDKNMLINNKSKIKGTTGRHFFLPEEISQPGLGLREQSLR